MSRIIARRNPVAFKTQALHVQASPEVLRYTPVGNPLSFDEMLALRQPVQVVDPDCFELTVANLGVSADITFIWQQRAFRVLVRQQRPDRNDDVLKLLSGYVPAHELRLPLLTLMTELAEELLLETGQGWLPGRYQEVWLPAPYADTLPADPKRWYQLAPQQSATRAVMCRELNLLERPRAYVHLPTNSLQLVYYMRLTLPACKDLNLLHADETLDAQHNELVAQLDPHKPDLYLAELIDGSASGRLFTLEKGELIEQQPQHLLLSEAFAPQSGWIVAESHCNWPHGLVETP
ncbi:MAG: metal ABC transporter ATPase [Pseudomonas sp.]